MVKIVNGGGKFVFYMAPLFFCWPGSDEHILLGSVQMQNFCVCERLVLVQLCPLSEHFLQKEKKKLWQTANFFFLNNIS